MEKSKDIPRGFRLTKEFPRVGAVRKLAWSASGTYLAVVLNDGVCVWNVESPQVIRISRPNVRPLAVTWSPDERMAVGWSDGRIEIRAQGGFAIQRELTVRKNPVVALAWSPDGKLLVSGTDIGQEVVYQLFCWDTKEWGEPKKLQPRHKNEVTCLSWSPDSRYLVSGSRDFSPMIWDAGRRELIRRLEPKEGGELNGTDWSPDGTFFATGSHNEILIWNISDKQPIHRLKGHSGVVTNISISRVEPILIATKSLDGTVRLWDTTDWKELALLIEPSSSSGLAFHPKSFRLAAPGDDGTTVKVWGLDIDVLYGRKPEPPPAEPPAETTPETPPEPPASPGGGVVERPDGARYVAPVAHVRESEYDIAIVCALDKPELEKVKNAGGAQWEEKRVPGDPQYYYETQYRSAKGSPIRVVAAAPSQMGMASTAVLATKMIYKFLPKCIIMVGIAAGTEGEGRNFGDILAARMSYDYNAGKIKFVNGAERFLPEPTHIPISPKIHQMLIRKSSKHDYVDEIRNNWPGKKPESVLKLHVGPIASGAAVLDSRKKVEEILEYQRKLIGIEMEIYGLYTAARETVTPDPYYIAFKSVCDFAENKTDHWQDYAAYTAAEFCYRFIVNDLWDDINDATV